MDVDLLKELVAKASDHTVLVSGQSELDAAILVGATRLAAFEGQYDVSMGTETGVFLAFGTAQVFAHGRMTLCLYGHADAFADGQVTVHAYEDSRVAASGSTIVHASGRSFVDVSDGARVVAKEDSIVVVQSSGPETAVDAHDSAWVYQPVDFIPIIYGDNVTIRLVDDSTSGSGG